MMYIEFINRKEENSNDKKKFGRRSFVYHDSYVGFITILKIGFSILYSRAEYMGHYNC
jgi:hypothetical protein